MGRSRIGGCFCCCFDAGVCAQHSGLEDFGVADILVRQMIAAPRRGEAIPNPSGVSLLSAYQDAPSDETVGSRLVLVVSVFI